MASGTVLAQWFAPSGRQPASNPAGSIIRNGEWYHVFATTPDQALVFAGKLRGYAGGGITAKVTWTAASLTTGNVKWNGELERRAVNDLDVDGDSFAAAQSGTDAVNATAGKLVETTFAFTHGAQIDSCVDGDCFRFRLTRDTSVASDLAEDAHVLCVELVET